MTLADDSDDVAGEVLEPISANAGAITTVGLGPAAERFARNTLRKSAQTQRTYLSVYRRFAAHLTALTGRQTRARPR